MTRKDYVLFAKFFKAQRERNLTTTERDYLDHIEDEIMRLFKIENPRFKRKLFVKASGREMS